MINRYIIAVKSAGNIAMSSCELLNNGVKVFLDFSAIAIGKLLFSTKKLSIVPDQNPQNRQ